MIFAKLEFKDQDAFLKAAANLLPAEIDIEMNPISGIGVTFAKLNVYDVEPTFNEEGDVIDNGQLSAKYHVDVMLGDAFGSAIDDLPEEIVEFEVFPEPPGKHCFIDMEALYEQRYSARASQ